MARYNFDTPGGSPSFGSASALYAQANRQKSGMFDDVPGVIDKIYNRREETDKRNIKTGTNAGTAELIDQIRAGKTPQKSGMYDAMAVSDAGYEYKKYQEAQAYKKRAEARAVANAGRARSAANQKKADNIALAKMISQFGAPQEAATGDSFYDIPSNGPRVDQYAEPSFNESNMGTVPAVESAIKNMYGDNASKNIGTEINDQGINKLLDSAGYGNIDPLNNAINKFGIDATTKAENERLGQAPVDIFSSTPSIDRTLEKDSLLTKEIRKKSDIFDDQLFDQVTGIGSENVRAPRAINKNTPTLKKLLYDSSSQEIKDATQQELPGLASGSNYLVDRAADEQLQKSLDLDRKIEKARNGPSITALEKAMKTSKPKDIKVTKTDINNPDASIMAARKLLSDTVKSNPDSSINALKAYKLYEESLAKRIKAKNEIKLTDTQKEVMKAKVENAKKRQQKADGTLWAPKQNKSMSGKKGTSGYKKPFTISESTSTEKRLIDTYGMDRGDALKASALMSDYRSEGNDINDVFDFIRAYDSGIWFDREIAGDGSIVGLFGTDEKEFRKSFGKYIRDKNNKSNNSK